MTEQSLSTIVNIIVEKVFEELKTSHKLVPIGVSNRHIHLSKQDREYLFGKDSGLTKLKDLSQPGQFACKEVLLIKGLKGEIKNVRILGPDRIKTQIELLRSDCFKLGIEAKIRDSGCLEGSSPITLEGPCGSLYLKEGAIVAKRHIHISEKDAKRYGVANGQTISVRVDTERGGMLHQVLIRAGEKHSLEMHIDTDEANAMCLNNGDNVEIV